MLFSFASHKFSQLKALMFTDAIFPNSFQVGFTLILTIVIKKGLNCSGVVELWGYMRGGEEKGG